MAEAGPSLPGISCAGEWLGWRMAEVMFCSLSTLALIPTKEDAKTYFLFCLIEYGTSIRYMAYRIAIHILS